MKTTLHGTGNRNVSVRLSSRSSPFSPYRKPTRPWSITPYNPASPLRALKKFLGAVVWRGVILGIPVAAVVGWGDAGNRASGNEKTSSIAGLWIVRMDMTPGDAVREGGDVTCGGCRHRSIKSGGQGSCYTHGTVVFKGGSAMFGALERGRYTECHPSIVAQFLLSRNLGLRLGVYGDPGFVPAGVLGKLVLPLQSTRKPKHVGYTHMWKLIPAKAYAPYLMASVDTQEEQELAIKRGWRVFRVAAKMEDLQGLIICPASEEAGKKTTCNRCFLCSGTASTAVKSVGIIAHGNGRRRILKALGVLA